MKKNNSILSFRTLLIMGLLLIGLIGLTGCNSPFLKKKFRLARPVIDLTPTINLARETSKRLEKEIPELTGFQVSDHRIMVTTTRNPQDGFSSEYTLVSRVSPIDGKLEVEASVTFSCGSGITRENFNIELIHLYGSFLWDVLIDAGWVTEENLTAAIDELGAKMNAGAKYDWMMGYRIQSDETGTRFFLNPNNVSTNLLFDFDVVMAFEIPEDREAQRYYPDLAADYLTDRLLAKRIPINSIISTYIAVEDEGDSALEATSYAFLTPGTAEIERESKSLELTAALLSGQEKAYGYGMEPHPSLLYTGLGNPTLKRGIELTKIRGLYNEFLDQLDVPQSEADQARALIASPGFETTGGVDKWFFELGGISGKQLYLSNSYEYKMEYKWSIN